MALDVTRRAFISSTASVAAALLPNTGEAWAQSWPSKPIKLVVAYSAGGLTDLFARAYGEYLSQKLGQPILVENKPGAGGIIAAQAVKWAAADGYALMFTTTTSMLTNRVLYKNLPYDADKDFVLICSMSAGHLPLVVGKATDATSLKEFVDYARKNQVSIGTYGAGSFAHIAVVELNRHFGLQMQAVHYRGEGLLWQNLAAGVLQGGIGSYTGASSVLQAGVGTAIAVPQMKRMQKLPQVATFYEQGVESSAFQLSSSICLVGPTGVPQEIVRRVSDLMVEAGKSERVQRLLDTFGIDESAIGQDESKRIYAVEGPIRVSLVQSLGLAPE